MDVLQRGDANNRTAFVRYLVGAVSRRAFSKSCNSMQKRPITLARWSATASCLHPRMLADLPFARVQFGGGGGKECAVFPFLLVVYSALSPGLLRSCPRVVTKGLIIKCHLIRSRIEFGTCACSSNQAFFFSPAFNFSYLPPCACVLANKKAWGRGYSL